MKALKIIIAILFTGFIFFHQSCDIVDEPYLVPTDTIPINGGDTTEVSMRKIILEDYTGHKCPNCPDAAEQAHTMQLLYGDSLIVIAIHAGFFADPAIAGPFTADYRTTEGTELHNFFGVQQYPSGMINRADYEGSNVLNVTQWDNAVKQAIRQDQLAKIRIENEYNQTSRELSTTVYSEFLENLEGQYSLSVMILESGIISPQQSDEGIIDDYVHNHMLRATMNTTWGDPVGVDGSGDAGTEHENVYNFTLDQEWIAANCEVVAFIYKNDTKEVIQAEEAEVEK